MAFLHGVKLENNNHPPGVFQVMTGNMLPGSASIGAWVNYGLGTENQDLPGFIVLADGPPAVGGAGVWASGFLPAAYQGTLVSNLNDPIANLKNMRFTQPMQRKQLDLGFLDAPGTQRQEVLSRLSVVDTAYSNPRLFWGRWSDSKWGYWWFVAAQTGGAGDAKRVWHVHNLLVSFDENGAVRQVDQEYK